MQPSYDRIPEKMRPSARRYVEEGRLHGDFLHAVLTNDLTETFFRADMENKRHLEAWVMWLYNDIPGSCWGSQEAINEWIDQGGLQRVTR